MNKERRKQVKKAIDKIEAVMNEIRSIQEEEQEAYDNLPEGLQESDRGQQMYEYADILDTAANDLDNVIDNLSEVAYQ